MTTTALRVSRLSHVDSSVERSLPTPGVRDAAGALILEEMLPDAAAEGNAR